MATDIAAFVGAYPFRAVDVTRADHLVREMDRVGIDRAWVGHLGAFLHSDPRSANEELAREVRPHRDRLLPVPTVRAGLPQWERDLQAAVEWEAPAVRIFPQYDGCDPAGGAAREVTVAAAERRLAVVLTVRFEDVRQRHPLDAAGDLQPSTVRALARLDRRVRLAVCAADRAFVEEVHFGLTADEARRVVWDVSWIWGPPEDHLALLLETIGADRFVLGTSMPLRIPEASLVKLELLDVAKHVKEAILDRNLASWLGR